MYSLQEVAESRDSDIEQDTEEKEASKEPVVEKLPENMETNTDSVAMEANDTSALDNVTMDAYLYWRLFHSRRSYPLHWTQTSMCP